MGGRWVEIRDGQELQHPIEMAFRSGAKHLEWKLNSDCMCVLWGGCSNAEEHLAQLIFTIIPVSSQHTHTVAHMRLLLGERASSEHYIKGILCIFTSSCPSP